MAGSKLRRKAAIILAAAVLSVLTSSASAAADTITTDTATARGTEARAAGTVKSDTVELELREGGVLHVKETITYEGGPLTREVVTRTRYDDANDRVFPISDFKGDGTLSGDTITISGSSGTATLEYDVRGA